MKKGKTLKEILDIYNKIKIITLDDIMFMLWSKVISPAIAKDRCMTWRLIH
jgi:hypothetical protein